MVAHDKALVIAEAVRALLEPHCERIQIAGSLRRDREAVNDIELVCIPQRRAQPLLFGEDGELEAVPGFQQQVNVWPKVRGEPTGKYTRRRLPAVRGEQLDLDLFMVTADNWGLQLCLRTGSAAWVHQHLACRAGEVGLQMRDGFLWDAQDQLVPVPDEATLFALLKQPVPPPHTRESPRVRNARFSLIPSADEVIYKCPLCGTEKRHARGPHETPAMRWAWRSCLHHFEAPEAQTECAWVDLGGKPLNL